MAGEPYSAGGILSTVAATRATSDADLAALAAASPPRRPARRHDACGGEVGLWPEHGGRTSTRRARGDAHRRRDLPRRPHRARRVRGPGRRLRRPGLWRDALGLRASLAVDRRVLRSGRVRRGPVARRPPGGEGGGARPPSPCEPARRPGPGARLAVEEGAASADHCTHLTDEDVDALAASDTVVTFLPAADFCTRQPYADARRVLDAGATVALASNCNPGSSPTSSMPFCIALAVREMRMTVEEALLAATLGGAKALRRDDLGRLSPSSRADLVVLDAPTYLHLASRPGMALAASGRRGRRARRLSSARERLGYSRPWPSTRSSPTGPSSRPARAS